MVRLFRIIHKSVLIEPVKHKDLNNTYKSRIRYDSLEKKTHGETFEGQIVQLVNLELRVLNC